MQQLKQQIKKELSLLNFPAKSWLLDSKEQILDVAIIGGGMAGLAAALALMNEGIHHFRIFDENPRGKEGPWAKFARMKALRSEKHYIGPALNFPSLTFSAFYEARYGECPFEFAPTPIWREYLEWFREVLQLPVCNEWALQCIEPGPDFFILHFNQGRIFAKKVVLATGQGGSGTFEIPDYMQGIPKRFYYHTNELFSSSIFKKKRVVVVGAGASAFDAAATALENQAADVTMLIRRAAIPSCNPFAEFAFKGLLHGFYFLPDSIKTDYFKTYLLGAPPPLESVERIKNFENFQIHYSCSIEKVQHSESLNIKTNSGIFQADYLLFGTGYKVDLKSRPELAPFREKIALWENAYPYLGPSFEFTGEAPYLKNIYCFNNGASASHGLISNDIPGVSIGASRLAKGIAIDFFLKGKQDYLKKALKD